MTRVYARPVAAIAVLAMFGSVAVLNLALAGWFIIRDGLEAGTVLYSVVTVGGLLVLALVVWRRAYVAVSEVGVRSGWFRSPLVTWGDIEEFRVDQNIVSAMTTDRTRMKLVHVPFIPLLFDSPRNVDRAINRLLDRLESERQQYIA